jgi:ankyrin repeat protein
LLRILLEQKAEVNAQCDDGSTPLHRAAWSGCSGCPEVVQLLLDHSADADVRASVGETPLHHAALGGHLEVARILLERNAEVNSQDNRGHTPLHLASFGNQEGHPDVVRLLLDHGGDVHVRDLEGNIASSYARGPKQQEIVQLLSQHTCKMNAARRGVISKFDLPTCQCVSDDSPACLLFVH